jgi:hypothetical protein
MKVFHFTDVMNAVSTPIVVQIFINANKVLTFFMLFQHMACVGSN